MVNEINLKKINIMLTKLYRNTSLLVFMLLVFFSACTAEKKKEEPKLTEHPFIALLKAKSIALAKPLNSPAINEKNILKILWSGNGVVSKSNSSAPRFTHPVNFANMVDLYLINKNGVYFYNYNKNKLKLIKKGNQLNKFKIVNKLGYKAQSFIVVTLNPGLKKVLDSVSERLKDIGNKELVRRVKERIRDKQYTLRESSIIEAGAVSSNIMLLSGSQGFKHFPIKLKRKSNAIKRILGIKKKKKEPFLVIPLGHTKNTNKQSSLKPFFLKYLTHLLKSGRNSKKDQFDISKPIPFKMLLNLFLAANGVIKVKGINKKSHPSGLPNSYIELYYVTHQLVQKYDPASNSLKIIKHGDYRRRLGEYATKYSIRSAIVLAIITDSKKIKENSTLFRGYDNKIKRHYRRLTKNTLSLRDLSLFQVGVALQNIRLLATDYRLAYQHIDIPFKDRGVMAGLLSLNKGDQPVFIIPLGVKK